MLLGSAERRFSVAARSPRGAARRNGPGPSLGHRDAARNVLDDGEHGATLEQAGATREERPNATPTCGNRRWTLCRRGRSRAATSMRRAATFTSRFVNPRAKGTLCRRPKGTRVRHAQATAAHRRHGHGCGRPGRHRRAAQQLPIGRMRQLSAPLRICTLRPITVWHLYLEVPVKKPDSRY